MYVPLLVLIVFILWYIKKTNENCPRVLKMPARELFMPVGSKLVQKSVQQKKGDADAEPLNDRVTENYRGNPYFIRKAGMGDVTKGLWSSDGSQVKKSNDGRLNEEYHAASDTITPEYRNSIASAMYDMHKEGSMKSKIKNLSFEGNSPSHPWSQYKN